MAGEKSRAKGRDFERKARKWLEEQGWIVVKNTNQVDLEKGIQHNCKPKYNPFTKSFMMNSGGFPDFICYRKYGAGIHTGYNVVGVEVKYAKYFSKEEKEKCEWLLDNNIYSKIYIVSNMLENNKSKIYMREYEK